MEALAVATGHLTPKLLKKELEKIKIPPDKILITHPKPQYLKTIMSEIKKLGIPNIRILKDSEFLGLLGPSGSGKSTILKCIYRTYIPTHGSIWYDSISYGKINLAFADEHTVLNVRHKEIGYVSQFLKVIPRISAIDIVAEPLLSKNGLSKQEGRKRACELLERLRIPSNLFDAYPCTFSGGEEKWINIARAIIWRPRFLLLDEPVASLDKKSMDTVILLFKELQSQGSSIVGIFHDVKLMERIADRIFEIDGGATPPISY
ncbi:MAG: Alpha-D-ribose 1-methylphosphonate 5-triphosphate synthase subunit PhnL [candidate division WS2 bacterium]|nr:Alpha-D-ribose 1-methylphosphonate 5-triphosphate synthase subunit PhnL [Candidatus Psychracetigena formicireducens]